MSISLLLSLAALATVSAFGQISPSATWAITGPNRFQVQSGITYLTASGYESKLDVFRRRDKPGPHPTLIYIHGGGWTSGGKEDGIMHIMPWLEMGWQAVNVEYRLARVAPAPAAVEDCLCALRWVVSHAAQYGIDPARLVVAGDSAGGHLALTTGMIPASAALDRPCLPPTNGVADAAPPPMPKVAAIVDWYGITDVTELLDGKNRQGYAVEWLSRTPNREEVARSVSPLTYVRPGLPPVFIIHGDADPTVPYTHSVRLQSALEKVEVPNQLITVPGGRHGQFPPEERLRIYAAIRDFLTKHGLPAYN